MIDTSLLGSAGGVRFGDGADSSFDDAGERRSWRGERALHFNYGYSLCDICVHCSVATQTLKGFMEWNDNLAVKAQYNIGHMAL